jgi:alkylation response protein AidB-like acyl-CoA dehydrogenase
LCPLLTFGAIDAIVAHGSDEQRSLYLPKLIAGEWSATMNLTEPHAGSDVGALVSKAVPNGDGSYAISGTKIFITFGEHDLTDNIVHLVLARTPGVPAGTKGISMFIVPKYLPDAEGNLGTRNDLKVVSIEHKLGIKASPTCVMSYGEDGGGATGWLLGEEGHGMRNMFTMMNSARISVGLEGMAIAERAYQQAVHYARERQQGRVVGGTQDCAIVEHPDVRRMLLTMRSNIEAMRALLYRTAMHEDFASHASTAEDRTWHERCVALLTPVVKTWCTDLGVSMSSVGVQVHGGMGFIEETGAAQHFRDARITPIYEGTNGIQSIDLAMRKLPLDQGVFVHRFLDTMESTAQRLAAAGFDGEGQSLSQAVAELRRVTTWLLDHHGEPNDVLAGATPYCSMFGIIAGGWIMAEAVLAADTVNEAAIREKTVTSRFYLNQIVPTALGLAPSVTAGCDDLFALGSAEL